MIDQNFLRVVLSKPPLNTKWKFCIILFYLLTGEIKQTKQIVLRLNRLIDEMNILRICHTCQPTDCNKDGDIENEMHDIGHTDICRAQETRENI
jgi:hypothetical protein